MSDDICEKYQKTFPLLTLKDVGLNIDGKQILKHVNATVLDVIRPDVKQGQVVSILGKSGIGKSQLLRLLAGLTTNNDHVKVTGQVLVGREQLLVHVGNVGMVAQNYPLFEDRSVLDNLLIAAKKAGHGKKAKERSEFYLERFNLADKKDDYPGQLSGGQRQRVAIAQQLVRVEACKSKFLLLDEPFTGLDPLMLDEACHLISEVALLDEEMTILISSHILSASVMISDTLWLMGRPKHEDGTSTQWATIVEEVDLIKRGLAWHKDVSLMKEFGECVAELRARFLTL